jgi:hypothetical protein
MARDTSEQYTEFAAAAEKQDSQQITDLIEQLDRDLKETRKHAAKER